MSRTQAKKRFTVVDQIKATEGIECRKDDVVIDEVPMGCSTGGKCNFQSSTWR
jgi:RNA-splicing ligase RtcB